MDDIPTTTTPVDEGLSDRTRRGVEHYRKLFKEDSPRGEFHRRMRDTARVVLFEQEPLCPECEEEEAQAENPPKDG